MTNLIAMRIAASSLACLSPISSLMQVARDRKTWCEVVGAVVGAGVVALVVGGLATYAVTQITLIAP